jgi:hypothetical protein
VKFDERDSKSHDLPSVIEEGEKFVIPTIDPKAYDEPYSREYECWKQAKEGKQGDFGKESMHEESDNWKEEQHAHMQGRPNDITIRVLVMYCNG